MKNNFEVTLNDYLNKIGEYTLLTARDEQILFSLYKEGSPAESKEAKQKIIESNLRLVVNYAKYYAKRSEIEMLDLIQEGNIGLVTAVERFSLEHNTKFSTYATFWIKQQIIKYINDKSRCVRIPTYMQAFRKSVYSAEKELSLLYDRPLTNEEVASATNIDIDKVKFIRENIKDTISYEIQVGEDGSLKELLADERNIEDEVHQKDIRFQLNKALESLTERERIVVEHRFGLNGKEAKTLDQVAQYIDGVTRERVRQIEANAIAKLQKPSKIKYLENLL